MPEPAASESPSRVLGFDFGTRRIGLAFGQRITGTAQALAVIAHGADGPDWQRIDSALREWRPEALVVGLPLALDGGEQATATLARRFARALGERSGLPVHLQDERMTSIEADRRFAAARRAGQRRQRDASLLDAIAAQVIVENFLAQPVPRTASSGATP
jgi:putative Holliday junction resolvase